MGVFSGSNQEAAVGGGGGGRWAGLVVVVVVVRATVAGKGGHGKSFLKLHSLVPCVFSLKSRYFQFAFFTENARF